MDEFRTTFLRAVALRAWCVPLLAILVALPTQRLCAQVAVIVNTASGEDDISADRLRRLFLGQATSFSSGDHARLATHVGSAEVFDRNALGLQRENVRARWLAITFRGEAITLPTDFANADDVKRFVREHQDAIGFLPASDVDNTIKLLRVDGKRPTDPGYLIR